MLYISAKDIEQSISLEILMSAIEQAYQIDSKGEYFMPDRIHVEHKENTLLYMPCFTDDVFGTKMLTIFPENSKKNLPVIDGFVFLHDSDNGKPLAMIDGGSLTAYRTGAVGGVGINHTVPKDVKTLGLIGTGTQGFYQILYACAVRDFETIYIYNRTQEKIDSFISKLQVALPNHKFEAVDSSDSLVQKSDVIITATSSSDPVMADNPLLFKNKHFISIGSYTPDMRELPKAIYSNLEDIYVDTLFAKEESGDLATPLKENWINDSQIKPFSHALNQNGISNKTTLFKSVGMGLFDLIVANTIYKTIKNKNLGQNIEL